MSRNKSLKVSNFDEQFFADPHPAVAAALDQKLAEFLIQLELAPQPMYDDHRRVSMQKMYDVFFNKFLELELQRAHIHFSHDLYDGAEKVFQKRDPRKSWFRMSYTEPGSEFLLTVADAVLTIELEKLPLRKVVYLAAKVFQPLLKSISSSEDVSAALGARQRLTKIDFAFYSKFRLGKHKDEDRQEVVKNFQILLTALGQGRRRDADVSDKMRSEAQAFRSLGVEPDDHVRIDFDLHALKHINGSRYVIKILTEAPFNEQNSILYVKSVIGSDERFFSLDRSLEAETAFMHFFKDVILKQFLNNLLCSATYSVID